MPRNTTNFGATSESVEGAGEVQAISAELAIDYAKSESFDNVFFAVVGYIGMVRVESRGAFAPKIPEE